MKQTYPLYDELSKLSFGDLVIYSNELKNVNNFEELGIDTMAYKHIQKSRTLSESVYGNFYLFVTKKFVTNLMWKL
jgi:hypothetical protein